MAAVLKYVNGAPQYHSDSIFGKETKRVLRICVLLERRFLFPAEHGHPTHPATKYIIDKEWRGDLSIGEARDKFIKEHPGEFEKYCEDVQVWRKETGKLLGIIYGIAKRRHMRIVWLTYGGVCMPDRFMVYKKGEPIAMVQC